MTTLTGNDLSEYLDLLEQEITKRQDHHQNDKLTHRIHGVMADVIKAEKSYLDHTKSIGVPQMLSFSGNGLPSIESLNADLEAMCKFTEDEFNVARIRNVDKETLDTSSSLYKSVSEDQWVDILSTYDEKKISKKESFAINEMSDGRFQLSFNEKVYLKGVDKFCQEHPIMGRSGNMIYNLVWQQLFEESTQQFYAPNKEVVKVKSGLPVLASSVNNITFDDINIKYKLNKSNFVKTPVFGTFGVKNRIPKEYHNLVEAGTDFRVQTTQRIFDIILETLGYNIGFGSKNYLGNTKLIEGDLREILSFTDLIKGKKDLPWKWSQQRKIQEDLCFNSNNQIKTIGHIVYGLPVRVYDHIPGFRFKSGQIELQINGNIFSNPEQYIAINKALRKRKILK